MSERLQAIWQFAFRPVLLGPDCIGNECCHCGVRGEYIPSALVHKDGCKVAVATQQETRQCS